VASSSVRILLQVSRIRLKIRKRVSRRDKKQVCGSRGQVRISTRLK
jgi:hypothetical protein